MFEIGDKWLATDPQDFCRLDQFLTRHLDEATRSQIQHWINSGCFEVSNKKTKKSLVLDQGDQVLAIKCPDFPQEICLPEPMELPIHYEEDSFLVLNKPAGIVVHPGQGNTSGTLANGLVHYLKNLGEVGHPMRPGIIHRLDKDTTGLLVVAKTLKAHQKLSEYMLKGEFKKKYLAWCWRHFKAEEALVDLPIDRDPRNPLRRAVIEGGKPSRTHYQVIKNFEGAAYVSIDLLTGRTHQIRVHFSHLGHPILGDAVYGGNPFSLQNIPLGWRGEAAKLREFFPTQALHAWQLQFPHPEDEQKIMSFEAPLPPNFESALRFSEETLKLL